MPNHSCCVPFCRSRGKQSGVKYFKFPVESKLRKQWKLKIKRGDSFNISNHTRICSLHFKSGKWNRDPHSEDYLPTIFPFNKNTGSKLCSSCRRLTCKCGTHNRSAMSNHHEKSEVMYYSALVTSSSSALRNISNIQKDSTQLQATPETETIISIGLPLQPDAAAPFLVDENFCDSSQKLLVKCPTLNQLDYAVSDLRKRLASKEIECQRRNDHIFKLQLDNKQELQRLRVESDRVLNSLHEEYRNKLQEAESTIKKLTSFVEARCKSRNNVETESEKNIQSTHTRAKTFSYEALGTSDSQMRYYTGLPTRTTFDALYLYLQPLAENMSYWRGRNVEMTNTTEPTEKRKQSRRIDLRNQMFLTLCRLKRGYGVKDLADFYSVTQSLICKVFITWCRLLDLEFKRLFPLPSLAAVQQHLPPGIAIKYPKLYGILDCAEFKIEVPCSLLAQSATYSNYKHANTYKVLYLTTPCGAILFASDIFSGKTSDKEIVLRSGLLDCIPPGSEVLADRGFELTTEFKLRNLTLNIPDFKGTRSQLTAREVWHTEKIANTRIHVERAIRRIKCSRLLDADLHGSMSTTADIIFRVIAFLQNFLGPNINVT